MPCAIFQIPKQWAVVCWLTETLSTSFLECSAAHLGTLAKAIYRKLIDSTAQFYLDSDSPQMIKSQILKLLMRLIRKLRFLLRQGQASPPDGKTQEIQETVPSHFEEICISSQFVKSLLCDIEVAKNQDEMEARASARYDAT